MQSLLEDLLALAGVSLIIYGAWLASPPAAFVVGGVFCLLVVGALYRRRPAEPRKKADGPTPLREVG